MDPLDLTLLLVGEDRLGDDLFAALEEREADVERAPGAEALDTIRVAAPDLVIIAPTAVPAHADRIRDGLLAAYGDQSPRLLVLCTKATAARVGAYRHGWIGTLEPEIGCLAIADTVVALLEQLVDDPERRRAMRTLLSGLRRTTRTAVGLAPGVPMSMPTPPAASAGPRIAAPTGRAAPAKRAIKKTLQHAVPPVAPPPPAGVGGAGIAGAVLSGIPPVPRAAGAETVTVTEFVTAPAPAPEVVIEAVTEAATVTEAVTEAETEAATESVTEAATVTATVTEAVTEAEAEAATVTEAETEAATVTESGTEAATEAETETEAEFVFEAEAEAEFAFEAEAEAEFVFEAEAESGTEAEFVFEVEAASAPELEPAADRLFAGDGESTLRALSDVQVSDAPPRVATRLLARVASLPPSVRRLALVAVALFALGSSLTVALGAGGPERLPAMQVAGSLHAVSAEPALAAAPAPRPAAAADPLEAAVDQVEDPAAEDPELGLDDDDGLEALEDDPGAEVDVAEGARPANSRAARLRQRVAAANKYVGVGHRLRKQRRLGMAEAFYLKALKALPNYPRAMSGLVRVHLARRDGAEALRWAKRLTQQQPRRGNNQLLLGDAFNLSGNRAQARNAWQQAQRLGSAAARTRTASLGR